MGSYRAGRGANVRAARARDGDGSGQSAGPISQHASSGMNHNFHPHARRGCSSCPRFFCTSLPSDNLPAERAQWGSPTCCFIRRRGARPEACISPSLADIASCTTRPRPAREIAPPSLLAEVPRALRCSAICLSRRTSCPPSACSGPIRTSAPAVSMPATEKSPGQSRSRPSLQLQLTAAQQHRRQAVHPVGRSRVSSPQHRREDAPAQCRHRPPRTAPGQGLRAQQGRRPVSDAHRRARQGE